VNTISHHLRELGPFAFGFAKQNWAIEVDHEAKHESAKHHASW